jgi:hypothetical protein
MDFTDAETSVRLNGRLEAAANAFRPDPADIAESAG